ncbi:uncharacterized protein LOC128860971 isoform X1 [Anastrepha ludens]|uniref:uncharacterized protein LOC128860971 isoform X1 n=1 Tax=Anastrepha ludens TaxID=28586 RepID=UPI0023AFAFC1|nr:uncharacterized protein LOC128860971 isoform X1 [Anastrepha ludens]
MSSLDIYDDSENLISSDEYTEEDDDELMNAAISSQPNRKPGKSDRLYNSPPRQRSVKREQRLPFRRKLCTKYKSRSLKWLYGKAKREKSKEYLLCLRKKESPIEVSLPREKEYNSSDTCKEDKVTNNLSETIDLDESDVEYSSPIKSKEEYKKVQEEEIKEKPKDEKLEKPKELVEEPKVLVETPAIEESAIDSNDKNCLKRAHSPTPTPEKNGNANKRHQPERPTSTHLYREINEMFPKYDEVVASHVKHKSSTSDAIDESMTRLMLDIQTLNDILQTKETEWNRLLNLKRVKEEMLARLSRAKHVLGIKDRKFEEHKYNLQVLKELESYLSEPQSSASTSTSANIGLSTTHQLIENRASMKTEDLQKERNNTNRLQNILISSNILQRAEMANYDINDGKINSSPIHHTVFNDNSPELQKYQYLEQKLKSKVGRQGPFIDVKSMVADFRQQNPVVFPRVGKRIKANDSSYSVRALSTPPDVPQCIDANSLLMETSYNCNGSNYTPTLEKLLSTTSRNNSPLHVKPSAPATQGFKFNTESQKSYYRLQNDGSCNEISITPVNCVNRYPQKIQNSKSGLLRTALDVNSQHNSYYDMSGYVKSTHKTMRDVHNNDLQLCQECKMHEARFVCAGCGNQWYCSRDCQVNAWDKHSEVCSE